MWALEKGTTHLNHGSYGAVPAEILSLQGELRARLEANPTRFMMNELQPGIERARIAVAEFIGADPDGVVFTRNASTAVASVIRSIEHLLGPGDQIVTTTHDYNAVRQTLNFASERTGVEVIVAPIPYPVRDPSVVSEAVLGAVGERTRLVVIDHITSPTALIYPVDEIVTALEPEIPVLVDGAHGPGQVPLDMTALGASWYTGNLHKWVCAPKGAAFLHTRADRTSTTVPTVISHGFNAPVSRPEERYHLLFDWLGTDDLTPWLVIPDVLAFLGDGFGGWPAIMKRNHDLVVRGGRLIAQSVGTGPMAPESMVGSMTSIRVADGAGPDPGGELSPLMPLLIDKGFAVLAMNWPHWPQQLIRVSAHLYNEIEDYKRLATVLADLPES